MEDVVYSNTPFEGMKVSRAIASSLVLLEESPGTAGQDAS